MQERSTRPVASYATYAEAERAVDRLSDLGFPVAIMGHDVHLVERPRCKERRPGLSRAPSSAESSAFSTGSTW